MKLPSLNYKQPVQKLHSVDPRLVAQAEMSKSAGVVSGLNAAAGVLGTLAAVENKYEIGKAKNHLRTSMAEASSSIEGKSYIDAGDEILEGLEYEELDHQGNVRDKIPTYEIYSQVYDRAGKKAISESSEMISMNGHKQQFVDDSTTLLAENNAKATIRAEKEKLNFMEMEQSQTVNGLISAGRYDEAEAIVSEDSIMSPQQDSKYKNLISIGKEKRAVAVEDKMFESSMAAIGLMSDDDEVEDAIYAVQGLFEGRMERSGIKQGTEAYKLAKGEVMGTVRSLEVMRQVGAGDTKEAYAKLNQYKKQLTNKQYMELTASIEKVEVDQKVAELGTMADSFIGPESGKAYQAMIQTVRDGKMSEGQKKKTISSLDSRRKRAQQYQKEQGAVRYVDTFNAYAQSGGKQSVLDSSGLSAGDQTKVINQFESYTKAKMIDANDPKAIASEEMVKIYMRTEGFKNNPNPSDAVNEYITKHNIKNEISQAGWDSINKRVVKIQNGQPTEPYEAKADKLWNDLVKLEKVENPRLYGLFVGMAAKGDIGDMNPAQLNDWGVSAAKSLKMGAGVADFDINYGASDKKLSDISKHGYTIEFDEMDSMPFGITKDELSKYAKKNFGKSNDKTMTAALLIKSGTKLVDVYDYMKKADK